MTRAQAFAKINLAHVVGPMRADGRHEIVSVLQRIDLHDVLELHPAPGGEIVVEGFPDDTLVSDALRAFAAAVGQEGGWRARIEKRIPVAAGLGGGSSDAAAALLLANELAGEPIPGDRLHALAAALGADVPFFLSTGAQLATGYGAQLQPLRLPTDFTVVVALPAGSSKASTADVYRQFDERDGSRGFEERREELLGALRGVESARDLGALPHNDLASPTALAGKLADLGAFRADVTGAGPAVYGLFDSDDAARRAVSGLPAAERTWLARPVAGL